MPKSASTTPPEVSITFAGFTSRCTTPVRCTAPSASSSEASTFIAKRGSSAPVRARTRSRDSPSMNSITRNAAPGVSGSVASV